MMIVVWYFIFFYPILTLTLEYDPPKDCLLNLPSVSCSLLSLHTIPEVLSCIDNLGELHFVGDSITRTALADFTSRLLKCDKPLDKPSFIGTVNSGFLNQAQSACSYLSNSRKTRKPYSLVISQNDVDATQIKIFYWPVTTVQNITQESWFNDLISLFSSSSLTTPRATLILNWGLWNLKYDDSLDTRLAVGTANLVNQFKQKGVGNNPRLKVFWRSISLLEGKNPLFPVHFTPEFVRDNSFQISQIWSSAGYPVINSFSFIEVLAEEFGHIEKEKRPNSYVFTTDGTHYKEVINVGLIAHLLSEMCKTISIKSTDIVKIDDTVVVANVDTDNKKESTCCNNRGLVEENPSPSPLPTVAPLKSTNTVSVWTTTSLVVAMFLAVVGVSAFMRTPIKDIAATPSGIIFSAIFISIVVMCLDVLKLLPIVTKERQIGPDSLIAITGILFLVVLFGLKTTIRRGNLQNVHSNQIVTIKASSLENSTQQTDTQTPKVDEVPSSGPKNESESVRNDSISAESEFLSPEQTLEFKGWMMCIFLLYHYWDVKLVYNLARILVAAYLFLTGYGNFLSLSKKAPTIHKFCIAFVRINAFSALLMCVTRQSWMLYYICPLHTLWTAFVYIFFAVWPSANTDPKLRLAKLFVFLLVLIILYEIPSLTRLFYIPFFPLLSYKGTGDEWIFRSRLDAYVPWIGMLLANFQPQVQDFVCAFSKMNTHINFVSDSALTLTVEQSQQSKSPEVDAESGQLLSMPSDDSRPLHSLPSNSSASVVYFLRSPVILWICLVLVTFVHTFVILPLPKTDYNESHRFTSWVPIISYLLFRNSTPDLRKTTIAPLQLIGNMSLESYLLQFHVWLANNAKDIVVLFPNFRLVSFVIQTAVFLTLAYTAAAATSGILKVISSNAKWAYFSTSLIILIIVIVNMSIVLSESSGWGWH
jgi:N-acetylneuraminate 9-O-acetyltransferase